MRLLLSMLLLSRDCPSRLRSAISFLLFMSKCPCLLLELQLAERIRLRKPGTCNRLRRGLREGRLRAPHEPPLAVGLDECHLSEAGVRQENDAAVLAYDRWATTLYLGEAVGYRDLLLALRPRSDAELVSDEDVDCYDARERRLLVGVRVGVPFVCAARCRRRVAATTG